MGKNHSRIINDINHRLRNSENFKQILPPRSLKTNYILTAEN